MSRAGQERFRFGPGDALYVAALLIAIGSFLYAARSRDLRFPIPWPDEGSFLWQAIAIEERNTLFSPELNPERHVLWMQPFYMVFQGLIFKLTGFSLGWARALSAIYLCAAVACLAWILFPLRARFGHLLFCLIFLQSPIAALTGNIARMEALMLLVAFGGTLLIARSRPLGGVALLALGPLIHPNGVFVLGGAIAFLVSRRFLNPRPPAIVRKKLPASELCVLAGVAVCWLLYGAYVARHWEAFVHDIGEQLATKAAISGGIASGLVEPRILVPAALLVLICFRLRRSAEPVQALFFLALSFLALTAFARGWLYEIYTATSYVLLSIVVLEIAAAELASRSAKLGAAVLGGLAAAQAAALLLTLNRAGWMTWSVEISTKVTPGPPYFTAEDHEKVARFLTSLRGPSGRVSVQFFPDGDGLLFKELRGPGLSFLQPTFYAGQADVQVLHDSVFMPDNVKQYFWLRLFALGIPASGEGWRVIHSRDGSESWSVYQRPRR